MNSVSLSYILTTYNKFNYLKITLPLLINSRQDNEEIVVVDGGSIDGTADFLQELYDTKKIQTYVSERDQGEAHGINKAILMAKGNFLKIITDDDVFDFEVIKRCKEFMTQNPSIDMMGYDGYSCKLSEHPKFELSHFIRSYRLWLEDRSAFLFCGLSFMIRRSSLAYLGLFNPAYKIVDMEYSLRVSSLNTRLAFYTGPGFVNLVNPASNSVKYYESLRNEYRALRRNYPKARINFRLNNPSLLIKERLSQMLRKNSGNLHLPENKLLEIYPRLVEISKAKLEHNRTEPFEILAPK